MADFKLRAPPRLRMNAVMSMNGVIGTGGTISLSGSAAASAQAVAALLRGAQLSGAATASAQGTAALLKGILLQGSAVAQASSAAYLEPSWSDADPIPSEIQFTDTAGDATFSLVPFIVGWNASRIHIELDTGSAALPTGVTLDPSNGLAFSDAAGSIATVGGVRFKLVDNPDDWVARSTAAGVVFADRLDGTYSTNTSTTPLPSTNSVSIFTGASHISRDTTIKPTGAAASTRFDVLNADGADSGTMRCYFGGTHAFDVGETFWFSFRLRYPKELAHQHWVHSGGQATGPKFAIVSYWGYSHTNNELDPGDPLGQGTPNGYLDGVDYDRDVQGFASACSASDFREQKSIDRGANPLTGNNPDTGSAWTACQQDRGRYGHLYSAYSNPGTWEHRRGFGDPFSGALRFPTDEWFTITGRFIIGTPGTPTSRYTLWMARDGLDYVQLRDDTNFNMHAGEIYNTIWPMPYVTSRVAGGRKISSRTSNITGVELYSVGPGTPVGDGTLSWNASTQRLTWAGAGESAGTAVGFSAANGFLTRAVISSPTNTSNMSFVLARFTPGDLPLSNQTDTVTIADGRPDMYCNYADVIVSSQPINAPGGFAPA